MKSNSAKLHRFKGSWIKDWMGFDPATTPNVLAGIAGVVCMTVPKNQEMRHQQVAAHQQVSMVRCRWATYESISKDARP